MPPSNKITKTALKKMSKAELVTEANEAFGVVLDANSVSKDEMIDEILNLQDNPPEVSPVDEPEENIEELTVTVTNNQTGQPPAAQTKGKKMFRIIVDESDDPNASDYCDVGVNGYTRRIKRGEEVVVPREVISVLQTAVQTVFYKDAKGNDKSRSVPRFAWRIIEEL